MTNIQGIVRTINIDSTRSRFDWIQTTSVLFSITKNPEIEIGFLHDNFALD